SGRAHADAADRARARGPGERGGPRAAALRPGGGRRVARGVRLRGDAPSVLRRGAGPARRPRLRRDAQAAVARLDAAVHVGAERVSIAVDSTGRRCMRAVLPPDHSLSRRARRADHFIFLSMGSIGTADGQASISARLAELLYAGPEASLEAVARELCGGSVDADADSAASVIEAFFESGKVKDDKQRIAAILLHGIACDVQFLERHGVPVRKRAVAVLDEALPELYRLHGIDAREPDFE